MKNKSSLDPNKIPTLSKFRQGTFKVSHNSNNEPLLKKKESQAQANHKRNFSQGSGTNEKQASSNAQLKNDPSSSQCVVDSQQLNQQNSTDYLELNQIILSRGLTRGRDFEFNNRTTLKTLDLFGKKQSVDIHEQAIMQKQLTIGGLSHRDHNSTLVQELRQEIKDLKSKYELRLQVKLEEARLEFEALQSKREKTMLVIFEREVRGFKLQVEDIRLQSINKDKLIRKLVQLLARQESELLKQHEIISRIKERDRDDSRIKQLLTLKPGAQTKNQAQLEEYVKEIGEEVELLYQKNQVLEQQLRHLQTLSEDCIKNADHFQEEAMEARQQLKDLEVNFQLYKQKEEERFYQKTLEYDDEKKVLEEKLNFLQKDYHQEIELKDAIIGKLQKKTDQYKGELDKVLQILRYPRLMNIACKRLNYDRIEITEIKPKQNANNTTTSFMDDRRTQSQSKRPQTSLEIMKRNIEKLHQQDNMTLMSMTIHEDSPENMMDSLNNSLTVQQFNQIRFKQKRNEKKVKSKTQNQDQIRKFLNNTSISQDSSIRLQDNLIDSNHFKTGVTYINNRPSTITNNRRR